MFSESLYLPVLNSVAGWEWDERQAGKRTGENSTDFVNVITAMS